MKEKLSCIAIIIIAIISFCITAHINKFEYKQTQIKSSINTQVSKKHTNYTTTEKSKTNSVSTKENKTATKQTKKSTTTSKCAKTSLIEEQIPIQDVDDTLVKTTIATTQSELPTSSYNIPLGDNFYGYMDYLAITNTSSDQYKFQQLCWTDSQGLRRQGNDYVVALGSYYSTKIGDRFLVSLDTGITYTIVLGDCKADCHTNSTNQYVVVGNKINIIEFIVDTYTLDYTVAQSGNIGTYDNLTGNVIGITKIE